MFKAKNLSEVELKMKEQYDLVLIDLNMPDTSGWEIINKYQEELQKPTRKAFICTSSIDPRDHQRAAEMNHIVERVISKPIDVSIIESYL